MRAINNSCHLVDYVRPVEQFRRDLIWENGRYLHSIQDNAMEHFVYRRALESRWSHNVPSCAGTGPLVRDYHFGHAIYGPASDERRVQESAGSDLAIRIAVVDEKTPAKTVHVHAGRLRLAILKSGPPTLATFQRQPTGFLQDRQYDVRTDLTDLRIGHQMLVDEYSVGFQIPGPHIASPRIRLPRHPV